MTQEIAIAGRPISAAATPYVIAEMSANHGGSIERAFRIIEEAARAGADAIKFQAYTADSLTIDCRAPGFTIAGDGLWAGQRLYELYKSAATPLEWFPRLFERSRSLGITPFASPFDAAAVELLQQLQAPAYKIASFEAVDLELIAACARTGKPLIISTGLCTLDEIADAVDAARSAGAREVMLLKCVSAYPADAADANLASIPALADHFAVPIGLSDHTLGTSVAIAACALGAVAIEKHFIDAKEPPTADSQFSALPAELAALVQGVRLAHKARGGVHFGPSSGERDSLVFRRSLYAVADIGAGEPLTRSNVRCIRPGYGLAPKHLHAVLGRIAKSRISRGAPLTWELIE
jgi:N-acetylneuraminate synthase